MTTHDDLLRRISEALAELYDDQANARRIARSAGLSLSRLDLEGAPVVFWGEVVAEAGRQGKIDALLALAIREYPASADLTALRAVYGAGSPEASRAQRPQDRPAAPPAAPLHGRGGLWLTAGVAALVVLIAAIVLSSRTPPGPPTTAANPPAAATATGAPATLPTSTVPPATLTPAPTSTLTPTPAPTAPADPWAAFAEAVDAADLAGLQAIVRSHPAILDTVPQSRDGEPLIENLIDFPVAAGVTPAFTRFIFQPDLSQLVSFVLFVEFLDPADHVFVDGTSKSPAVEQGERALRDYIDGVYADYDAYCQRAVRLEGFDIPLSTLEYEGWPKGVLVVGRRKTLTTEQLRYLAELSESSDIDIVTYDALFDYAEQIAED